jgi:hypothetical protein
MKIKSAHGPAFWTRVDSCKIEFWPNKIFVACNFKCYTFFLFIFFLGRTYYSSLHFVCIKFIGHNLKVSHYHHVCIQWLINNISYVMFRYIYTLSPYVGTFECHFAGWLVSLATNSDYKLLLLELQVSCHVCQHCDSALWCISLLHKTRCIMWVGLTLFILVRHTSKLNYRIIIVNTIWCDSIRIYLLPLHVSVSWPSSEGLISTC